MAAIAAHTIKLYLKSSSTAPSGSDEIANIKDCSFKSSKTMLDITDFKDTTAAHIRMAGLEDGAFSISGDYNRADSPQLLIQTAFEAGATYYLTILPDGTNGYSYPVLVSDYEVKAQVDGTVEVSANLVMSGAKIARP
jgi:predicted secreted protein